MVEFEHKSIILQLKLKIKFIKTITLYKIYRLQSLKIQLRLIQVINNNHSLKILLPLNIVVSKIVKNLFKNLIKKSKIILSCM